VVIRVCVCLLSLLALSRAQGEPAPLYAARLSGEGWARSVLGRGILIRRADDVAVLCRVYRDQGQLEFVNPPKDLSRCRQVRLQLRAGSKHLGVLALWIRSARGSLLKRFRIGREPREVVFDTADMWMDGDFDPSAVTQVGLGLGARGGHFTITGMQLIPGPPDWRLTRSEIRKRMVGAKRAIRVTTTKRYRVIIEEGVKHSYDIKRVYSFTAGALGVWKAPAPIDIYLLRDRAAFLDYIGRYNWEIDMAGHATRSLVATHVGAPPGTLAHELTHSLFYAEYGRGGGSWLQEGAAVFVQERWAGRSAAKRFCRKIPPRERASLRSIVRLPMLLVANSNRTERNYMQAGAIFEYLRARHADGIKPLAQLPATGDVAAIEKVLDRSIDKFESEWKTWLKQHGG